MVLAPSSFSFTTSRGLQRITLLPNINDISSGYQKGSSQKVCLLIVQNLHRLQIKQVLNTESSQGYQGRLNSRNLLHLKHLKYIVFFFFFDCRSVIMVKTAVRSYITADRKRQRSHVEMHTHILAREHKNNLVKEQVIFNRSKTKYMCQFKKRWYKQG